MRCERQGVLQKPREVGVFLLLFCFERRPELSLVRLQRLADRGLDGVAFKLCAELGHGNLAPNSCGRGKECDEFAVLCINRVHGVTKPSAQIKAPKTGERVYR